MAPIMQVTLAPLLFSVHTYGTNMIPHWMVALVIFALSTMVDGVTTIDNSNPLTFYLPDHARKPQETMHEVNSDDDEEDTLIWASIEGFEVDPGFDLDQASQSYDARNQVKTVFPGKISPSTTAREIHQTEPCYDSEDPLAVGLGLDRLWDGAKGKGRGWERRGPSN